MEDWVSLKLSNSQREIEIVEDKEKLRLISKLDGCYCLTTSLTTDELDKDQVHSRYKDLAKVEQAFRTCKTGQLEMRPIYVRKSSRTRGHVLVVMLSYLLIQKLRECWGGLDLTVEEGIRLLETLGTIQLQFPNPNDKSKNITINSVPTPRAEIAELLRLANINAPEFVPAGKTKQANTVDSKKKLKNRRKP
jgi:hypothetical protein